MQNKKKDLTRIARRIDIVINDVLTERNRQDGIYGVQDHAPEKWLPILGEEFGEVCKAIYESDYTAGKDGYRNELVQLISVGVAMLECYDRNGGA